jgi:DNA repair exonuclease SbcCD ATPase subunit
MSIERLSQLEHNLKLLQEQLAGLEESKTLSRLEDKVLLEQRIKKLKQEIRPVEEEYWQTAARSANQLSIPEAEAEIAVGEIVEAVTQLELYPVAAYPDEMLQLLREIRDKLNAPGAPAAAKLKGAISSIPPFVNLSYEAELDTENFFRTHFPTFTKLIRGAAKK